MGWSMDRVHGVVHGPGPSGGPWTPVHVLYTSGIQYHCIFRALHHAIILELSTRFTFLSQSLIPLNGSFAIPATFKTRTAVDRNLLKTRRSWSIMFHFDLTRSVGESESVYTPNWTLIDLGLILNQTAFLSLFYELYPCMSSCLPNRLERLKLRMMSCFVTAVLLLPLFKSLPLWPLSRCRAPCHLSVVRFTLIAR